MHKTLGIVGGVSPESTGLYYTYITREYRRRFGDFRYPEIIIYSVNFQELRDWGNADRWDLIAERLVNVLQHLAWAGAQVGLIAANTLHLVFEDVEARSPMPLISIVDAAANAVQAAGVTTVGLLGTRDTMRRDFYPRGLKRQGIATLVPDAADQDLVSRVIYEELISGVVKPTSRQAYREVVARLVARGAEGVILGCTEIPLLIGAKDCAVPVFDSARIHADKALSLVTGDDGGRRH